MFNITRDYFYFIFRLILGIFIFIHGAQKFGIIGEGSVSGFANLFGLPIWLAYIAATTELLGGFLITIGFFTRLAALGTSIVMLTALIIFHFPQGWNPFANGGELPIIFFAGFLVIMAQGARQWSLERLLLKKETF